MSQKQSFNKSAQTGKNRHSGKQPKHLAEHRCIIMHEEEGTERLGKGTERGT
jgi:hypothetical protein